MSTTPGTNVELFLVYEKLHIIRLKVRSMGDTTSMNLRIDKNLKKVAEGTKKHYTADEIRAKIEDVLNENI